MRSLIPQLKATDLVPRQRSAPLTAPRQLDLVLDDALLQGLTTLQRQAALKALAQLLLAASGAVAREDGDDDT